MQVAVIHKAFGDNKIVAIVDCPDGDTHTALDYAYEKTNHIDAEWWDSPDVTLIGEPKHRSTSVGDVMVTAGASYMVASPFGFTEIAKHRSAELIEEVI